MLLVLRPAVAPHPPVHQQCPCCPTIERSAPFSSCKHWPLLHALHSQAHQDPLLPQPTAPLSHTLPSSHHPTGNAYCFKQCFDKQIKSPYCPKPYKYDAHRDRCEKKVGWLCEEWVVSGPTKDPVVSGEGGSDGQGKGRAGLQALGP